jgi:hypothetical protein
MNIGWILLIGLALGFVVWRRPIVSYVRGGPYLSTRLRRYLNQTLAMRPALLVTDDAQRDQWVQDICGAVPVSLSKFMGEPPTTDPVLSIINERQLDEDARQAFYAKLATSSHVIRVRGQLASVAGDTSDFDETGHIHKLTGNVVIEHIKTLS